MPRAQFPKRVIAVVDKCRMGERLCHSRRLKETGDHEDIFVFEPSGLRCGPAAGKQAINSGLLNPAGDSLLGPELSQTWVAA